MKNVFLRSPMPYPLNSLVLLPPPCHFHHYYHYCNNHRFHHCRHTSITSTSLSVISTSTVIPISTMITTPLWPLLLRSSLSHLHVISMISTINQKGQNVFERYFSRIYFQLKHWNKWNFNKSLDIYEHSTRTHYTE